MRIGLCVLVCLVLVAPAVGEPEGAPAVDARALVERLTSMTMNDWSDADRASLDRAMRVDPRGVLTALVDRLPNGDPVPAPLADSQTYTVCGQALTILDRLIGENVGGETRDWIGFATRDHRGISPSPGSVHAPWVAWLEVRRDVPIERWFWGLSYEELAEVLPLVRTDPASWPPGAVARVGTLGPRAYPFLLDKLRDEGWAGSDYRVCDRANELLCRLTGKEVGEIVRNELLRLSPSSPKRETRQALHENHASMDFIQRRWMAVLLGAG